MKSELVENLIIAHCSGEESKFIEACNALASDEENKGNIAMASRLRRAYESKKKENEVISMFKTSNKANNQYQTMQASSQTGQYIVPRDKDSLLELFEIVNYNVTIEDVILPEKQKEIIKQIIIEQTKLEEFEQHNILPINRLLLCGPPGCGKTMTAYALGKELNIPIAYVRLDGLVSSYLGQTSSNLRRVFDAVKNERILLFLDEFDAIAKKRDDSNELGELKRVVTTLLQNFDNMPSNVFLVAATNHEHLLDPAIWRRFNVTINLDLPNEEQRCILFEKEIKKCKIDVNIDYKTIAKITQGLNGAQLKEVATASAKKYLIEGSLKTEDIMKIFLEQQTKYSDNSDVLMQVICNLLDNGVSLRAVAKAMGIPHNTLDYKIKKYKGGR